MQDNSAGNAAQRSALGGAWNTNPFAAPQANAGDNTLINRPANLAQVSSPAAAAEHARGWQAQSGAVDFLGLDAELSGAVQPVQAMQTPVAVAPQPAPVPMQHAPTPEESWLLEMHDERGETQEPAEPDNQPAPDVALATSMLNQTWKEAGEKKQRNKLIAPLCVCALGAIGLGGVVWMRGANPETLTVPIVSSVPAPAAKPKDAPLPANDYVATRELTPVELLPGEIQPGELATPQPVASQIEVAQTTQRETSEARALVDAPEEGGFDSLVEVVPPAAPLLTPPLESSWAPDPFEAVAPGESALGGEEADASNNVHAADELAPYDSAPLSPAAEPLSDANAAGSSNAASVANTPAISAPIAAAIEPGAHATPLVSPIESDWASFDSDPVPAPESSLAEPIATTPTAPAPLAETSEPAVASQPPVVPLVEIVAAADNEHSVESSATPSAAASQFVGPLAPGVELRDPLVPPAYGPVVLELIADVSAPPADSSAGIEERRSVLELEQVLQLDQGASNLRRASAGDLKGMWSDTTIPLESIGAPTKLLTPAVGKVRVVLGAGEIFEGELYAVGEGCVWLNTQYGRMGLAGTRVKSVTQIDSPKGAPALGAPGSQDYTGMERVRIKTPGGVIYGKVIERDALKTTVVTQDGARLVLDSKDVELLSQAPAVTIKR